MTRIHDAPWLRLDDNALFNRFLLRFSIAPQTPFQPLVNAVTRAFHEIPYENLTKVLKADAVISASSAMRYPDEVLRDYLTLGAGGTCFSLTAALVAVLDALGIKAYPLLADRHYGIDTHCGVLLVTPGGALQLLDPGYLLFAPVNVPAETTLSIDNGFNRIELKPLEGGSKIELWTVVKTNRKLRLTFKMIPVSDDAFGRAWERSFAFEMMTYPVLTRHASGRHLYLQGDTLTVRSADRTERTTLSIEDKIAFINHTLGIDRAIALKAMEVLNGRAAAALTR
jgi:arylamine N-acetyltransferase